MIWEIFWLTTTPEIYAYPQIGLLFIAEIST
jgi:hypothetical protein